MSSLTSIDIATFGAGCFWGVEAAFRQLEGVTDATVGYSGGHASDPTYKDVCRGDTGHAEVVQVKYDATRTSYEQLLDLFWQIHNPTTPNRQGGDVGSQYRSIILTHSPEQEEAATASREQQTQNGRHEDPIVTKIVSAETFYAAEDYHQRYLENRGLPSCHLPPG